MVKNEISMFPILPIAVNSGSDQGEDERQLLEAAKANSDAFELLYLRYAPRVYRYFLARVEREEDAADLTQQVFLKILDALPRYQWRSLPFSAWVFRIARNMTIDKYRRQKVLVPWDVVPENVFLCRDLDPEILLLNQEQLCHLRQLIEKLSQYKQELLVLRFSSGLSYAEIAKVVGKSQASVKKQLERIVQKMKEVYNEE